MEKRLKIIRSAVGSSPSLGLIEELQKNNIEIIGIDANPLSFGLYNLEKAYLVPLGRDPEFIKELLKIIELEKPDAILSGPEPELLVLSKNKNELLKKGVLVLCPDYETVAICSDKGKTYKKFKEIGIPHPESYSIDSAKFPCIIKPCVGSGSSNVYKIENKEELNILIKKVKDPIIQEFVKGEEYSVDLLSDRSGNCLSIVPRLRITTESGVATKSKTIYDKEIVEYCRKISREFKLFGPSCIQCIKNTEGIKFLEVNLRFGGGSILSIKSDPTIIENLIRLIKNQKTIPSTEFKENLIMLRNYSEVYVDEKDLKKHESSNI